MTGARNPCAPSKVIDDWLVAARADLLISSTTSLIGNKFQVSCVFVICIARRFSVSAKAKMKTHSAHDLMSTRLRSTPVSFTVLLAVADAISEVSTPLHMELDVRHVVQKLSCTYKVKPTSRNCSANI
jgi:hypothetical protein